MKTNRLTVIRSATNHFVMACLCFSILASVCWARSQGEPASKIKAVQLAVELSDGSIYLGHVGIGSIGLSSPSTGGNVELPWIEIKSIEQSKPNTPVTVTFNNGDQLTGLITANQIQLTTLLGATTIPLKHIRKIDVKGIITIANRVPAKPVTQAPDKTLTPAKIDLDVGLIAHYPFDGDFKDTSGNGNDGKPTGKVDFTDGVVGKAARFHGISNRGFLTVPASKSLRLNSAGTVAFWLRLQSFVGQTGMDCSGRKIANTHHVVLAKSGDRHAFAIGYFNHPSKTSIGLVAHGFSSKEVSGGAMPKTPVLKRWLHVVCTFDEKGVRIFHDGKLVSTGKKRVYATAANAEPMYIGIQSGKGSCLPWWYPLHGDLDDMRVYRRSLNAAEVETLYGHGAAKLVKATPTITPSWVGRSVTNSIGMKLMHIGAGTFVMGDRTPKHPQAKPLHKVTITKPFYMGATEVSQRQWKKVMGYEAGYYRGLNLPTTWITWDQAVAFCKKLSKLEGKTYRLPTEAEWEYACRAGTTTVFSFGDRIAPDQGNYERGRYKHSNYIVHVEKHHLPMCKTGIIGVGLLKPNAWGLHDMHGNVEEWVLDEYGPFPKRELVDPIGPFDDGIPSKTASFLITGPNVAKARKPVTRGGHAFKFPSYCTSAARTFHISKSSALGFRVVMAMSTAEKPLNQ